MRKIFIIILALIGIMFFPIGLMEIGYLIGIFLERKRNVMQIGIINSDSEEHGDGVVEI